jgi:hypothetical protein
MLGNVEMHVHDNLMSFKLKWCLVAIIGPLNSIVNINPNLQKILFTIIKLTQ